MRLISYLLLAVIVILGITFAGLNAEQVTINYYIGKHDLPLSLLLVFTFVIGCLIGLIGGIMLYLKQKAKNYKLRHHIRVVEKELSNLRTIPVKDNP